LDWVDVNDNGDVIWQIEEDGWDAWTHTTHQIACRHNRPECWTLDDLEAARRFANHRITDRVQTLNPEERLATHIPITTDDRVRFRATIAKHRERRTTQGRLRDCHRARRAQDRP